MTSSFDAVREAKVVALQAEARRHNAEAALAEVRADGARVELAAMRRKEKELLALDPYHHTVRLLDHVDDLTVERVISTLTSISRINPGCDIEIVINSPGGSIVAGLALYDFLQELKAKGHKITTVARGTAASMAGILFQAGDVRKCGPEAWLLIHEGSMVLMGSAGEVDDTVDWVKRIRERLLDILAARSTLTREQIKRRWTRKDWWLSSAEAIEHGFADEVG